MRTLPRLNWGFPGPARNAATTLVALTVGHCYKLAFDKGDDDDLIDVGEDEDGQAWVPCRDVVYRWRRNEEGRLVYRLWWTKPIMGLDPDECGHDDDGLHEDGWYG